ncbi:MAG: 50S ribosomal protein L23 [Candidatus Micrarchaeaceae archaeon]
MGVLKYPLATEKALSIINNNIIVYVVDNRALKKDIKEEFEKSFAVKVSSVRIAKMPSNLKKAYIKIAPNYKASDIAAKLKLV